jgi:hypothetical protein
MNEESLMRQLSNPKSGAIVIIVFSSAYGPSLRTLEQVKRLIELFPSIQMLSINADEHRHLLSAPALNISEIPSVIMFHRGRPFSGPLTDIYQITDRIKRLAIVSMEVDDFDCVGTNIRLPVSAALQKWSASNTFETGNASLVSLFQPLYTLMDSLYDI